MTKDLRSDVLFLGNKGDLFCVIVNDKLMYNVILYTCSTLC